VKDEPLVSVVMAVRNGAEYLRQAVESVLTQTLADLEVIVVDDGSVDATADILDELAREDPRIRVLTGGARGVSSARNRAGREVRAPLLAVMDADDVALPSRLELQVGFLNSHPDVVVVGGAVIIVDAEGAELTVAEYDDRDEEVAELLLAGRSPVVHPATIMRTGAFRAVSGYRTIFQVAPDYDLWLRMSEQGRITNIREPVLRYRIHPGQASSRDLRRTAEATCAALASARARAKGSRDPLDSLESLDGRALEGLGIAPEDVAAREVDYALWLARTLTRGGRDEAAKDLWTTALQRSSATAAPRAARARVLRARADAIASGRRSLGLRLHAGALDPRGTLARRRQAREASRRRRV
jgi:Glycosyl transferase family 2